MDNIYQALADVTRREILKLLKKSDLTAGDIAENFNISKPSISHHLNILKNNNLVICERRGQKKVYSLNVTVLQEFMIGFIDMFNKEEK